jgi:hypothetical protein
LGKLVAVITFLAIMVLPAAAMAQPRWDRGAKSQVTVYVEKTRVGATKRSPTIYPRPGSFPGEEPRIDWAVAQDPFGNEFCLIRVLGQDERVAVAEAGRLGNGDDPHWRAVAGSARRDT